MQQRTVTPRRSLNAATRTNANTLSWQPISSSGSDVTFLLSRDSVALVKVGIPPVLALSIAAFPVAVAYSGAIMVLTYPSPPANPETFTLEAGTPQLRSPTGGYLAPGTLILGLPTPPPAGSIFAPYCDGFDLRGAVADGFGGTTDSLISANSGSCGYTPPPPTVAPTAWAAARAGPNSITIYLDSARQPYVFNNATLFQNLDLLEYGVPFVLDTHGVIGLNFTGAVVPGQGLQWDGSPTDILDFQGYGLWNFFAGVWNA